MNHSMIQKEKKWMEMCDTGAEKFSTCSRRQYFAIIVDKNGHVLSTGYNGTPAGYGHCANGYCPRKDSDSKHGSNYNNCYAVHAEANALLYSDYSQRAGATLYVNGPPCFDCAKLIANSGISKVVYRPDDKYEDWERIAKFLVLCGVFPLRIDQNGD